MSSLRQGVLRAVRLLPDAVKIGVKTETALPSNQEEEQLSHEEKQPAAPSGPGTSPKEAPQSTPPDSAVPAAPADPLKELKTQIERLQADLREAKAEKQQLSGKISTLETEVTSAKEAFNQKERALTASVDAARETARTEGRTQGHAEGLESGRQAGLQKARAEVEAQYREKFSQLVATLEGVSARLEAGFSELVALNQPRMIRLWQEMLEKMLQRESILVPDTILDVLSDVLSRLSDKNHILIYVSPEDLDLLQDRMQDEFEDILRGVKHLELKPDASVDRGSCLVETNLGIYDARWRTQLDQIETTIDKLFQKLGKAPKPKASTTRSRTRKSEYATDAAEPQPKKTARKTTTKKAAEKKTAPPKEPTGEESSEAADA